MQFVLCETTVQAGKFNFIVQNRKSINQTIVTNFVTVYF